VTSHQQETVSKNDSRFNHANKQFFAQTAARRPMVGGGGVRLTAARRLISVGGGGVRNSAARRHRRGAYESLEPKANCSDSNTGNNGAEINYQTTVHIYEQLAVTCVSLSEGSSTSENHYDYPVTLCSRR
jgi:hypothetical protein